MAQSLTHADTALPADWRDLFALTKPRVMSLVVFTALCGLLAAPGTVHPVLAFSSILAIALGAGASGAPRQSHHVIDTASEKLKPATPFALSRYQHWKFQVEPETIAAAGLGGAERSSGKLARPKKSDWMMPSRNVWPATQSVP